MAGKEGEERLEQLVETTSSFGSGASSSLIRGKAEDKCGEMKTSNRVLSDDEKLEQIRVQGTCGDLISPDSGSSESGTTYNQMHPMMYPDSLAKNHTGNNITTAYPVDPFQVQQAQDTGYPVNGQNHRVLEQQKYPPQQQQQQQYLPLNTQQQQYSPFNTQQQFVQSVPQYIPHHGAPYFPIYPPQQQPIRTQTLNDQNTPLFFLPHGQALRPHPNQELNKTVNRTTTMPNPSQIQSQYPNYLQIRHPSQSIPNTSNNYMYENSQVYYTQPLAAQYPNMALAPTLVLSESSAPSSMDTVKHRSTSSQP